MENQKKEKEITLTYLLGILKKSVIVMVIAAIIAASLAAGYAILIEKPRYQVTATCWVNNTSANYDYTSQAQTSAAISLAASCVELVSADLPVRTAVREGGLMEKLGYEDENECVNDIRRTSMIVPRNRRWMIFYMTVTTYNPEDSYYIMTSLQKVMPGVLEDISGLLENENKAPMITVISGANDVSDVSVVKSSPIKLGALAAAIAAVVVFVIYFVISIFDISIYGETTIKDNFNYPVVGNIPNWVKEGEQRSKRRARSGSSRGIVERNYDEKLLSDSSPFFLTEAFNTLRTNVIYSAVAAKNPVFAVTSDIAGAGKTVTSANLAIALSNLGKKVLFVECDMRCPAFAKLFGKEAEAGLSELLAGIVNDSNDVVVKLGYENLDVIFGGKIPPNPSELLSGYRMTELIEQWKNTYDYVILDTPPVCEVVDAGVLSNVVNGYIVTARCNHSNINGIKGAIERLLAVEGNIIGIVVNDTDPKTGGGKYKKYYSYGGYYSRSAQAKLTDGTSKEV